MTFSPLDQETIRALVREEIALDEMRRIEQAPSPACPTCGCLAESMGAGVPPTAPAPAHPINPGLAYMPESLRLGAQEALDDDMDGLDWGHLAMPVEGE
ncbi:MAG TPA: hypothetical protein VNS79_03750 [Sphingobium sp.]|nr:hypothetical protein [Sphingobium sp.]